MSIISAALRMSLAAIALSTAARAEPAPSLGHKLQAYIECTNRLSGRAYEARSRYLSWVGKSGPTGKERIIYGTYTIYDTADCKTGVEAANALEPHDTAVEAAGSAYVTAVTILEPLLKEADDYYDQQNYKDDKMAKGRALHPLLMTAWSAFEAADQNLRTSIDTLSDFVAADELAAIEQREGRSGRYHIQALMMKAKVLIRAESAGKTMNLAKIAEALDGYEAIVKATDQYEQAHKDQGVGSSFVGTAKSYLTTAKALMRRVRDKVPYDTGEKMILSSPGGGWMVEGSPARLTRDYNQLVDAYNRGAKF